MSDLTPFEKPSEAQKWPIIVIGLACAGLVFWLKLPGLVIAIFIVLAVVMFLRLRPLSPEAASLEHSIRLSADDIADVNAAYEDFLSSSDTDSIADRTLHRPALADPDCGDPDIERFHFEIANALRFLHRLETRLIAAPSIPQLEGLLKVTDSRALELQETWLVARKAAYRLGVNYKRD